MWLRFIFIMHRGPVEVKKTFHRLGRRRVHGPSPIAGKTAVPRVCRFMFRNDNNLLIRSRTRRSLPLGAFSNKMGNMVSVESAGITDVGRKRENNEDRISLDDAAGLYVVADGMGGHQAGEIASSLVVRSICEYVEKNEPPRAGPPSKARLSPQAGRLLTGIQWSNQIVHQTAQTIADYRGMGSTVAAVLFGRETLIAANVGDSPIYLIRNGKIDLLSVPHTLRAETLGESDRRAISNILTRAVGPRPAVEPDLCELSCFKDDVLVLCSDGLSTKVAPWEILSIAKSRAPEDACRSLVDLANERGGEDNVSTVVVRVTRVRRSCFSMMAGWLERLSRSLAGALSGKSST
jgi:protein phosphatase